MQMSVISRSIWRISLILQGRQKGFSNEYFDRDAMFTCSAETLFKIADGKADPILAVTLGKLKVEGNIDKALKLKDLINSKKKNSKK